MIRRGVALGWGLALIACARSPAPAPGARGDASPVASVQTAQDPDAGSSLLPMLRREAESSGLAERFAGTLGADFRELGVAESDGCLRVLLAEADVTLRLREDDTERALRVVDRQLGPHCVRRGTRLALASDRRVEVVVVASTELDDSAPP